MGIIPDSGSKPTRLNAVKINQSCQGFPLPVVLGKHKVQQSLLWLNGFATAEVSGGKGGGKGTGYLYSSDAIVGLCAGPILAIDDVWFNQSWLSNQGANENIVVPASGIYTPLYSTYLNVDTGVGGATSFSSTTNDIGAPSSTVLSGTDSSPFKAVSYGSPLSQGQYSVNSESAGTFSLTSVDNAAGGNTVYYGAITGGASDAFLGYTFVITKFANAANNSLTADSTTGYVCVSSTAGSLTLANPYGVAEIGSGTATEPGNTYHFSSFDVENATSVQISYTFKLAIIRIQEIDIVPDSNTPVIIGEPNWYGTDEGVIYYSSGTDTESESKNGKALIPVSTNPPTEAGTYFFISSGKTANGSQYIFSTADAHQEVLITMSYSNTTVIPKDAPSTLNFTTFNGAQGQAVSSLVTDTFPGEALGYTDTAYALYSPMELGESADVPNITYEVQTADGYGSGIVDANPVQLMLRVLTDPVWGLGSGKTPFPIACIDDGPNGTWVGTIKDTSVSGFYTSPITVTTYAPASVNGDWPGLGAVLGSTVVNTLVFNQPVNNYPIQGFAGSLSEPILFGEPLNVAGAFLNPMVAVQTTSNSSTAGTINLPGTTDKFVLDMTGSFIVGTAGVKTLYINYAWGNSFNTWALYIHGASAVGGKVPPGSGVITQGPSPYPTTGPTTGYAKVAEQSDGPSITSGNTITGAVYINFTAAGTYNYEIVVNQHLPISFANSQPGFFQVTYLDGEGVLSIPSGGNNLGYTIEPAPQPGTRGTGTSAWCWFAANGYFISANLDKQSGAAETMGKWLEAGACAGFMSEGLFKLAPFGDTTTAGNGCTWYAPQYYVVALDDSCFIAKDGEEPVKISRAAYADAMNYVQVKWANRQNQYSDEVTPEFDQAAINRYGQRTESPQDYDSICNLTSAQFAASMRVKRSVNIRNTFQFTLPFVYSFLEPMDLVTITTSSQWAQALTEDAQLGVVALPVRLLKIVDDPTEGLKITAEDYPYGVGQPVLFNKSINASAPLTNLYANPGNTEVVLFEATSRATGQKGNEVWIGATGASNNWGGCNILVSSDGEKYLEVGTITARARIGELNQNFPSASDPDLDDALVVDMAENSPPLDAGSSSDADLGNTLCFVDGEYVAYSDCSLTGDNQFTMNNQAPSVPGYIRRGQLGSTIGSHTVGSLFVRLDNTIFKYTYDPSLYGKTIYFKFQSFNQFELAAQDESALTAIPFTVSGSGPGSIDAGSGLVLLTQPKLFHGGPKPAPIIPVVGVGRLGWPEVVTPQLIAHTFSSGNGVASPAINTVGANFLVVAVNRQTSAPSTFSVSDSLGNTWSPLPIIDSSPYYTAPCQMFYCYNPTVGTAHTFKPLDDATNIVVQAWSNMLSTSSVYQSGSAITSPPPYTDAPGSMALGTVSPLLVNDVVISVCSGYIGSIGSGPYDFPVICTPPAGYTFGDVAYNNSDDNSVLVIAYKLSTASDVSGGSAQTWTLVSEPNASGGSYRGTGAIFVQE